MVTVPSAAVVLLSVLVSTTLPSLSVLTVVLEVFSPFTSDFASVLLSMRFSEPEGRIMRFEVLKTAYRAI